MPSRLHTRVGGWGKLRAQKSVEAGKGDRDGKIAAVVSDETYQQYCITPRMVIFHASRWRCYWEHYGREIRAEDVGEHRLVSFC